MPSNIVKIKVHFPGCPVISSIFSWFKNCNWFASKYKL